MSMQGIDPNFAEDDIDGVDECVDPETVDEEEQMLEHDGAKFCT